MRGLGVAALEEKIDHLTGVLGSMGQALVAYSGGADSAFLAEVAHRTLADGALAVTADSPSIPRRELQYAIDLALSRGFRHQVVKTEELDDERYASNPVDRCYFCKSALMDRLTPLAGSLGLTIVLGTNVDDLGDHRPGQRAVTERGARHPMVEAGLTKAEVRNASRELGLPTWDKPAAACLASRFAYGVRVTQAALVRVEAAEDLLLGKGFSVVRVRDLGEDRARVEVGADQVARLANEADGIRSELIGCGFSNVMIDERGYRQGSMNEGLVLGIGRGGPNQSGGPPNR